MIVFGCDSCFTVVKVDGEWEDVANLIMHHARWDSGWPCINSVCQSKLGLLSKGLTNSLKGAREAGLINEIRLNAVEFFRALCGFGTPEEIGIEPESIRAFLLSTQVTDMLVKRAPSGRTILDRLDLDNGVSLHLAASPHGAMIYKITRRRNESKMDDDVGGVYEAAKNDCVSGGD